MNPILLNIIIVLVSCIGMECVAWFAHKYLMHGLLWNLHKDHHKKESDHFFEKNDYFFLIFGIPGVLLIILGSLDDFGVKFWMGIGISLYGFAYFLIHDVFIHQRFKLFRQTNNIYFRAIRRAHKMHHKHINKEEGECFGMLWVPFKYFSEAHHKMES